MHDAPLGGLAAWTFVAIVIVGASSLMPDVDVFLELTLLAAVLYMLIEHTDRVAEGVQNVIDGLRLGLDIPKMFTKTYTR